MSLKALLSSSLALLLITSGVQAAISIGVNNLGGTGRNIVTSAGANADGAVVRIGFFNDPVGSAAIIAGNDFSQINSLFRPLGEGVPAGSGGATSLVVASTGKISGTISGITQTYLPANTRLYVWALNSASNPTQWALVSDTAWVAPLDDPDLGGSLTIAINNSRLTDAGEVAKGSISAGILQMAVVPEPTSLGLAALAGLGLLRRRRVA